MFIDPTTYDNWNEILAATPGASFFHTAAWAKVLTESYHYKPAYFTDIKNNTMAALCTMMDVRSALTGCRGVSLPFTDYCEPIATESDQFKEIFNDIFTQAGKRNWKYLEFRGGDRFFTNEQPSESYYGHLLDLAPGHEAMFKNLRDSTRRNIKKAENEGITISISRTSDSLHEFYRLNTQTRRDHGLPPQPYSFFKCLHKNVLMNDLGFVVLAHFNNKVIAANVYFYYADQLIYKYGASDKTFQHLRANNLTMWEAIKWGCDNGCNSLCFGRTELENEGLRQFKNGWGTRETRINYYRYDLQKKAFITKGQTINPVYNKIFSKTPIPVLKIIGSLLYRHMG